MLSFEREAWRRDPPGRLAGVDEAGRGPLAGPVVAAAVWMHPETAETGYRGVLCELTDSKLLSGVQRAGFDQRLRGLDGVGIGLGWADAGEIDAVGILPATQRAMARAVMALPSAPTHVLVDGLPVNGLPCPSTAIVRGDRKSLLIAAASVVAKVARDRYMVAAAVRHPGYGFERHKGYGTAAHMRALLRLGPCPEHRAGFRPVREARRIFDTVPAADETG